MLAKQSLVTLRYNDPRPVHQFAQKLVRAGGHFAGGTVLHWRAGAEGRGVLLTGDVVMVIPDRRYVSFMYSYPNLIPLPVREVERIGAALEPLAFEASGGGWSGRVIARDGKDRTRRVGSFESPLQEPTGV